MVCFPCVRRILYSCSKIPYREPARGWLSSSGTRYAGIWEISRAAVSSSTFRRRMISVISAQGGRLNSSASVYPAVITRQDSNFVDTVLPFCCAIWEKDSKRSMFLSIFFFAANVPTPFTLYTIPSSFSRSSAARTVPFCTPNCSASLSLEGSCWSSFIWALSRYSLILSDR